MMSRGRAALACAACFLGILSPARADPISPVVGAVTRLPDGRYRYEYAVTNTDSRADHVRVVDPETGQYVLDPVTGQPVTGATLEYGSRLTRFRVSAGPWTPISAVTSPPGFSTFGDVTWDAYGEYGPGLPGVGESVHFSFVSPNAPQTVWWNVGYSYFGRGDSPGVRYFTQDDLVGPYNAVNGYVVGPAPTTVDTPEPTSALLFGVGCLVAGSCLARRHSGSSTRPAAT